MAVKKIDGNYCRVSERDFLKQKFMNETFSNFQDFRDRVAKYVFP